MKLLTDIAIEHVYHGKGASAPTKYVMHPFENSTGDGKGRYEVIRDLAGDGKAKKRSAHLTKAELSELYARGLHDQFGIRLRLRPAGQDYPAAPPGKRVSSRHITPGSDFEKQVRIFDTKRPVSAGLREQLFRLSVGI
ncbi:hypothetical protein NYO99_11755 [Pelomonas sp. UHG3]|uniref:Uncharacterized protein n=1 Tax=Roseateles hydrophilus TaxID=2975054 RepID=A0ACC6CBE7_9BURK|nr:hypothetical protein [Pelomonas sp. UHG3]MCY4745649.1 hypothetical protein [Pelomonas sp. UHG3]